MGDAIRAVADPYKILQVERTAEQEVVRAAFRALALKYHPDHDPSVRGARRMSELNQAYQLVRDAKSRSQFERERTHAATQGRATQTAPTHAAPPARRANDQATRLTQGRYAGWTLRDLVAHDPDYLRWLSRHSSGLRYRREIMNILGSKGAAAA